MDDPMADAAGNADITPHRGRPKLPATVRSRTRPRPGCVAPGAMASASSDTGTGPADVSDTQPAGKAKNSRAAPEGWPALLRRCEELELAACDLDLEHETIEAALAAIDAANKAPAWKAQQRKKLRSKLQRAIDAAQPPPEEAAPYLIHIPEPTRT